MRTDSPAPCAAAAARVRVLQERTAELVADELWDSAVLLGSLTASMSGSFSLNSGSREVAGQSLTPPVPHLGLGSHVTSLAIYAAALRGDQQTKSAESVLRQALQLVHQVQVANRRSNALKLSTPVEPEEQSTARCSYVFHLLITSTIPDQVDAELKFALARLQQQQGNHKGAIQTLESTSAEFRTCAMLATLGNLYKRVGAQKGTSVYFHDAVRSNPFVLEAAFALLRMGYSFERVNELVMAPTNQTRERTGGGDGGAIPTDEQGWVAALLEAHALALGHKHEKAVALFGRLETTVFPGNVSACTSCVQIHLEKF
jgi:hypothetical protein